MLEDFGGLKQLHCTFSISEVNWIACLFAGKCLLNQQRQQFVRPKRYTKHLQYRQGKDI
jgi:hypothetical protein